MNVQRIQRKILITGDGVACLADFAISALITNPTVEGSGSMSMTGERNVRYMTPEQIEPSKFGRTSGNASKESDVHCFAMTAYEVRSPVLPRGRLRNLHRY